MSKASQIAERYERYQQALGNAHAAAMGAQQGMVENMNALDCGFAWVVVHDTAFMTWCRNRAKALEAQGDRQTARLYGSKHYGAGWTFWCPGSFVGQSIGIHEAGARAFRDSLAHALQIRCETGSRLD